VYGFYPKAVLYEVGFLCQTGRLVMTLNFRFCIYLFPLISTLIDVVKGSGK